MKRHAAASHENHERWLVSYADFITLLFAFFVVMFASTQADKKKARQVSEAVRDALEHGQLSNAISVVLGRTKHDPRAPARPAGDGGKAPAGAGAGAEPPVADLGKSLATLQKGLDVELKAGKVQLRLEGRGLVISLREAGFFASGEDGVAPQSFPTLAKIAAVIAKLPNQVRLEGHTDSVPIHNSRFRSNWELSAARAIAMLEVLAERYGIPRERMAVAGYAENAPCDTNATAEGRAHNRRVDVVLLSVEGLLSEPGHAPGPAPQGKTQ